MAEYLTNTADLAAVADAIREKGGTSAALVYPKGFVSAIQTIQAAKTEQTKYTIITANGSYTVEPDSGKVLSKVSVLAALPTETWTFTLTDDSTVTKNVVVNSLG